MKTVRELMEVTRPSVARAAGAVRRMAIRLTARALWQLAGYEIDGDAEVVQAEPFGGIGLHARPPSSSKPEAIVLMVGDAKHPVIVAVRDEKTRASIAGALQEDETMLFNSAAFVHVKSDGTIEARTPGGTAKRLATLDDVMTIRNQLHRHTHGPGEFTVTSGTTTIPVLGTSGTGPAVTAPSGTTKLKGE